MTKPRNAGEANHGSDTPRKRGAVGTGYDAEFVGYINVQLSEEDKENFSRWVDGGMFAESLAAYTEDGINFALKIEPKSGGFLASATQRRVDSPNAGLCVTARAREPLTALERVVFTVAYLSTAEKWVDLQPLASPDRW